MQRRNFITLLAYTGNLNFNESDPGGVNRVGAFLQSGSGSWVFGSGTDPWLSTNLLSTGGFTATTAFVITGTLVGSPGGTGTIFSDDGAILRQAGVNLGGNAAPQIATSANYTGLTTGAFEILYIETNGLPATLVVLSDGCLCTDLGPCNCGAQSLAQTPIPATLPLFATGLGALGLLGWRRKRNSISVK